MVVRTKARDRLERTLEVDVVEMAVDVGRRLNRAMTRELLGELQVSGRPQEVRDRGVARFMHRMRGLIGQRTRDALAVKRAQGVRLGRPREMSEEALQRIRDLHRCGHRITDIARILNAEGIATSRNGRWHPSGVARVLSWTA